MHQRRSRCQEEVTAASRHECGHSRSKSVLTHFPSIIPVLCLRVCVCVCLVGTLKLFRGSEGRETEVDFCCDGISLCQAKWALIGGVFAPTHGGFSTHSCAQSPRCHLLSSKWASSWYQQASYLRFSCSPSLSFLLLLSPLSFSPPLFAQGFRVLTGTCNTDSD